MLDNRVKQFFKSISRDDKINFRCLDEISNRWAINPNSKFYSKKAIEEFNECNNEGYGVYFAVNGSSKKGREAYQNEHIDDFRSCFVDIDIKDEIKLELLQEEEYRYMNDRELDKVVKEIFNNLTKEKHSDYKQIFINRISDLSKFKLIPSAIIETKNGYHVYYFLELGANNIQFKTIQESLIKIFNGDIQVKNESRLMRVPNTLHLKDKSDPFMIRLIELNESVRYDANALNDITNEFLEKVRTKSPVLLENISFNSFSPSYILHFHNQKVRTHKQQNTTTNKYKIYNSIKENIEYTNVKLIEQGFDKLDDLREKLGLDYQSDICYIDRNDMRDFMKQQDLIWLLGLNVKLGEKFHCLFHEDNKPSANIYMKEDYYYYKCHSSNCGKHYDITNIIEKLTKLPIHESFDYMCKLFNLTKIKTPWQENMEKLIMMNIDIIDRFKDDAEFANTYPHIKKLLSTSNTINALERIHFTALKKLPELAKIDKRDNVVVFSPMEQIVREIVGNDGRITNGKIVDVNRKIGIIIFAYLLNCIGIDELPDSMKQKALEVQNRKGNKKVKYNTKYYELVSLDTNTLEKANEILEEFFKHMTIKAANRESILRLYGKENADRCFPDRKEEIISDLNESISKAFIDTIYKLIENKGWTTENEIIENVIPPFNKEQHYKNNLTYYSKEDKSKNGISFESLDVKSGNGLEKMEKWYKRYMSEKFKVNIPAIISNYNLTKKYANKQLREKYNIPESVKGNVYYIEKEINVNDEKNKASDNKLEMLRKLIEEHPLASGRQLAKMMNVSEPYIRKLKKKL